MLKRSHIWLVDQPAKFSLTCYTFPYFTIGSIHKWFSWIHPSLQGGHGKRPYAIQAILKKSGELRFILVQTTLSSGAQDLRWSDFPADLFCHLSALMSKMHNSDIPGEKIHNQTKIGIYKTLLLLSLLNQGARVVSAHCNRSSFPSLTLIAVTPFALHNWISPIVISLWLSSPSTQSYWYPSLIFSFCQVF